MSDTELRRAAWSRDEAAFAELFDRHARAVYGYCFRRTADWAAAEDLTSIVFLEAWRKRATADLGGVDVRSWLFGVATNVLRNQRRSRRRYRHAIARLPKLDVEQDFADDLSERLGAQQRMRLLLAEIGRLPREQQEVLFLWASALSTAEIAAALGVAEGTVRTRLFRARRRFRPNQVKEADPLGHSPKESLHDGV
jgi:RNA polymerase sigma factor (sigma-70 family)